MSGGSRPSPMRSAAVRRQVLAEWRRYPEPRDAARHLHAAGDLVCDVLAAMGVKAQVDEETVCAGWAEAVGPFLAGHSCPVALRDGVLTVRVVQPSVRYTLEQGMRKELLERLQQTFGASLVRGLSFTTV